jgi:meiotic recombination protein SPO11
VDALTRKIVASASEKIITLADLNLPAAYEVKDLGAEAVMGKIEDIVMRCVKTIMAGEGFTFTIPTRTESNQLYVPELDRIVLKDKTSQRAFMNGTQVRKTTIMTKVVQLVYEILQKKIHITKRDLFYTDVKLFKNQADSDSVFDDVACMIGCTRSCLNIVASAKGLIVGRVSFRDDGDLINCMAMGVGGKAIPPFMDKITDIQSTAKVSRRGSPLLLRSKHVR